MRYFVVWAEKSVKSSFWSYLFNNLDWVVPSFITILLFCLAYIYIHRRELKRIKSEETKTKNASLAFVSFLIRTCEDCKICIRRMKMWTDCEQKILKGKAEEDREKWNTQKESQEFNMMLDRLRDDPFRFENLLVESYKDSDLRNAIKLLDSYFDLKIFVQDYCFGLWSASESLTDEVLYTFEEVEKRIDTVEKEAKAIEASIK